MNTGLAIREHDDPIAFEVRPESLAQSCGRPRTLGRELDLGRVGKLRFLLRARQKMNGNWTLTAGR